jgi:hypothetical protein
MLYFQLIICLINPPCFTILIEKQSIQDDVYGKLALALPKPERSNRYSGLIRNSYLLNKQMIIDNSCLGLANTQDAKVFPVENLWQG